MSLHLLDLGQTVLFAHVPKTGGTSIAGGRERVVEGPVMYAPRPEWPAGIPSLAFVRNPFDRAASAWRDMRYLRGLFGGSLLDFLLLMVDADPSRIADPATPEHHGVPMAHPVHGLQHAQWVGRTERLQADFDRFCDAHGIARIVLDRHRDSSKAPRGEWTTEARSLAERLYAEDFDLLERLPC